MSPISDDLGVTAGAGTTIRAIEIGGKLYQAVANTAFDDDGWDVYRRVSLNTDNSTSVTSTNTILHAIYGFNINAAVRYLKIYDKATAPTVGTDTPVFVYALPGGTTGVSAGPIVLDLELDNGLGFGIVTGITDASTTATAASEQQIMLLYKAQ